MQLCRNAKVHLCNATSSGYSVCNFALGRSPFKFFKVQSNLLLGYSVPQILRAFKPLNLTDRFPGICASEYFVYLGSVFCPDPDLGRGRADQ